MRDAHLRFRPVKTRFTLDEPPVLARMSRPRARACESGGNHDFHTFFVLGTIVLRGGGVVIRAATGASTATSSTVAVREAWASLTKKMGKPGIVIAVSTVSYALEEIVATLREVAGDVPFQGGTSCGGVMTDEGFFGVEGRGLALFGLADEGGQFGVGVAEIGKNPRESGKIAIERAMKAAGCEGEMPSAIWMITTPGGEEEVVRGIEDVVGPSVPLVGGSAADDTIEGNWRQLSRDGVHTNSVSVVAIYASGRVACAFHSGYDPTSHTGVVTKSNARTIQEIDGRPAARVYDEWTAGAIGDTLDTGGPLLAKTNLHPLGRKVSEVRGVPYFVLSHPERSFADGSMHLFTDVAPGERLVCMTGSVDNLVERAGNVVRSAAKAGDLGADDVTAGLVIFCGGCFLTVRERIGEVHQKLVDAMDRKPFLTAFTFGEQGRVGDAGNRHGNLMISALLLGGSA